MAHSIWWLKGVLSLNDITRLWCPPLANINMDVPMPRYHCLSVSVITSIVFTFLLIAQPNVAIASPDFSNPEKLVNQAFENIAAQLSSLKDRNNKNISQILKQEVGPLLDMERISKLVLASQWKRVSLQQKKTFMQCFTRQLRYNQANSLQKWHSQKWKVTASTYNNSGSKVAIKIDLFLDDETRNVLLRLHKSENLWHVYDIAFNGISLLKKFRDDYALRIENQGFGKTLAKLCQNYPLEIKKLVMAANEWPPFIGRSLPGQGFSVELVGEVFKLAGYEVTMAFAPWRKVMKGMEEGKFDVSVAAWSNASRQQQLTFSDAYYHNQLVVVSAQHTANTIEEFHILLASGNQTLSLMEDYAYDDLIPKGTKIQYHQHYRALLRKLASKDLDMALLDGDVARHFLHSLGRLKTRLQVPTNAIHSKSLHITMLNKHPAAKEVILDFNHWLGVYLASDEYQALLIKYKLAKYELN